MKYLLNLIPSFIDNQGYFAIWFLMWMETFLPVIPSEITMPLGVAAANHGLLNVYSVALAGTAGSMTGALVWYFIARSLGMERIGGFITRYGRITTIKHSEVALMQKWFDRYGGWVVFLGRLIPGVRSAVSIPAGLTRMRFLPFFFLSLAGAFIWNAALTWASWLGRAYIDKFQAYIHPAIPVIIICLFLGWIYRVVTYKAG
jgi:membrane protein DedA with SNARE-associated domain